MGRSLELLLINCEIKLDLTWSAYCIISETSRTFREVDRNNGPVKYKVVTATNGAIFEISMAKLYVKVVTLSINDNIKFLETIKNSFLEKI